MEMPDANNNLTYSQESFENTKESIKRALNQLEIL